MQRHCRSVRVCFFLAAILAELLSPGTAHAAAPSRPASFTVSQTPVATGARYSLNWSAASGAGTITYDLRRRLAGGAWAVAYSGTAGSRNESQVVAGAYEYRLRACNAAAECSAYTANLAVSVQVPVSIQAFSASASTTAPGERVLLSWNTEGATAVTLDQGIGTVPLNGSTAVTPARSTTWTLSATGFTGSGSGVVTRAISVSVESAPAGTAAGTPQVEPPADGSRGAVGAVAASHEVGSDGSANLSIPLQVPPGVQGMHPTVSLAYNSNAGNGIAGVGFDIAGLGAIHRCPATLAREGVVDAVDFDDNDRFCLDGQRLVVLGGAQYGADGAEYRLENDTGDRLRSFGSEGTLMQDESGVYVTGNAAANPVWFEVHERSGRISRYGYTPDSRARRTLTFIGGCPSTGDFFVDADGICRNIETGQQRSLNYTQQDRSIEWKLAETRDRFGNRITYTWDTSVAAEQVLARIDYNVSGVAGAGSGAALNSLRFSYESRPDVAVAYFAGGQLRQERRLASVAAYSGETKIREWRIGYHSAGAAAVRNSRVDTVTECAGGSCVPPTRFTWQGGGAGFSATAQSTGNPVIGWDKNPLVLDANGDGRDDMLQTNGNTGTWQIMLGNGQTLAPQTDTGIADAGRETARVFRYNPDDNRDDVLLARNGTWWVLKSMAAASRPFSYTHPLRGVPVSVSIPGVAFAQINTNIPAMNPAEALLADIDGDGRQDLLYRNNGRVWVRLLTDSGFSSTELQTDMAGLAGTYVFDADNDGRSDFLQTANGKWVIVKVVSVGATQVNMRRVYTNRLKGDEFNARLLDVDGDGLTDLLDHANATGEVFLLRNAGGELQPSRPLRQSADGPAWSLSDAAWASTRVVDFNADGRGDILYPEGGVWKVMLSSGLPGSSTALISPVATSISSDGWDRGPRLLDVTGNGMSDLLVAASSGSWTLRLHEGARPDYLASITNGMGVETRFEYAAMPDAALPAVYATGTGAVYPAIDVAKGAYLVSRVLQSDGVGGFNATRHAYSGLRHHLGGRGSLGFAATRTSSEDTGISTEASFSQDWQAGLQGSLQSLITTAGAVVTSDTRNTWQSAVQDAGTPAERRARRLLSTTVTKRDLNGAFMGTEENTYLGIDAHGNVGKLLSVLKDASGTALRSTTATNTWTNLEGNWLIGLLEASEVKTEVPLATPATPVTQRLAYAHDPVTGRKLRESVLDPASGTVLRSTEFGVAADGTPLLDPFGQSRGLRLSGPDFAARLSGSEYSADGRFLVAESNALGHTTTHAYFPDTDALSPGLLRSTTDPNGIRTDYRYDAFGRVVSTIAFAGGDGPGIETRSDYRWCASIEWCPVNAVYYIATRGADGSESFAFVDALGREVRRSTRGMDGVLLNIDSRFDHAGRRSAVSEPYQWGLQSPVFTEVEHDVLGRPVRTMQADGRIDTVSFDGTLRTSLIDTQGRNQRKVERRDLMGNLVEVTDNAGVKTAYAYDALGQLTRLTPPAVAGLVVAQTVLAYDSLGRKTSIADPDKGSWRFSYNGLGELLTQTDAKGQSTCMSRDLLGRMVKRVDAYAGTLSAVPGQVSDATAACANPGAGSAVTVWTFDTAAGAGKGQLAAVSGPDGYAESRVYNARGLVTQIDRRLASAGPVYSIATSRDALNRPEVLTYPGSSNRLRVRRVYNPYGYLQELRNDATGALYQRIGELDQHGNVVSELYGNGVASVRYFDRRSGALETIQSFRLFEPSVQNLQFSFDRLGNLGARDDLLRDVHESFGYDALNRLSSTTSDGGNGEPQTTTVTYDALGNIRSKTGVGTYRYGSECAGLRGPHAVCQVTAGTVGTMNTSYQYDANGNITSGGGRSLVWSTFDKPVRIAAGAANTLLRYGPERELLQRDDTTAEGTTSTVFIDGLFESVSRPGGVLEERHYVGDAVLVSMTGRSASSAGTTRTRYLHRDHLGSLTSITDESGQEIESFSFDPWGKRRAPSLASLIAKIGSPWTSLSTFQRANLSIAASLLASANTNRGFTGHEQLDGLGLIHMGGRVYDAELGRFLSADPFVQDGSDLQSLNRYSYVGNNPLSAWDPSGFFLKKLFGRTADAIGDGLRAVGGVVKRALQRVGRIFDAVPGLQLIAAAWFCGPAAVGCIATFNAVLSAAITAANGGNLMQTLGAAAVAYTEARLAGEVPSVSTESAGDEFVRYISDAATGEVVSSSESDRPGGVMAARLLDVATRNLAKSGTADDEPAALLVNPTGFGIRHDSQGRGEWLAPRGGRRHRGLDFHAIAGQQVRSPVAGEMEIFRGAQTGYPMVDIHPADKDLGFDTIRLIYVGQEPVSAPVSRQAVRAGAPIGVAIDLQTLRNWETGLPYPGGVTPHVHVEILSNGRQLDPTPWFFGR